MAQHERNRTARSLKINQPDDGPNKRIRVQMYFSMLQYATHFLVRTVSPGHVVQSPFGLIWHSISHPLITRCSKRREIRPASNPMWPSKDMDKQTSTYRRGSAVGRLATQSGRSYDQSSL